MLVIFDTFLHILAYFDNGESIFRHISSFWQILSLIRSIFNNFIAIFIFLLLLRISEAALNFRSRALGANGGVWGGRSPPSKGLKNRGVWGGGAPPAKESFFFHLSSQTLFFVCSKPLLH